MGWLRHLSAAPAIRLQRQLPAVDEPTVTAVQKRISFSSQRPQHPRRPTTRRRRKTLPARWANGCRGTLHNLHTRVTRQRLSGPITTTCWSWRGFCCGICGAARVTISMEKRAMKLRAMAFSVACLALGVVADAQAMRTTYLWGAFPDEPERFDSLFGDCQEGPTADLFPELCTSAGAALLSVTFVHDQPITNWDTNGCSEEMPELCVPFRYDSILGVVISGYTSFEGTEIRPLVLSTSLASARATVSNHRHSFPSGE